MQWMLLAPPQVGNTHSKKVSPKKTSAVRKLLQPTEARRCLVVRLVFLTQTTMMTAYLNFWAKKRSKPKPRHPRQLVKSCKICWRHCCAEQYYGRQCGVCDGSVVFLFVPRTFSSNQKHQSWGDWRHQLNLLWIFRNHVIQLAHDWALGSISYLQGTPASQFIRR